MSWEGFWTLLLSAGLFLFAALAVIVAIGAFFDVGRMFRALDRQHAGLPDEPPDSEDPIGSGDPEEPNSERDL